MQPGEETNKPSFHAFTPIGTDRSSTRLPGRRYRYGYV